MHLSLFANKVEHPSSVFTTSKTSFHFHFHQIHLQKVSAKFITNPFASSGKNSPKMKGIEVMQLLSAKPPEMHLGFHASSAGKPESFAVPSSWRDTFLCDFQENEFPFSLASHPFLLPVRSRSISPKSITQFLKEILSRHKVN